jgi:DNA-binding CsgD family transcriptional regulator
MKNANRARVVQELADLFHRDMLPDDPNDMIGLAFKKLARVIAFPQTGVFTIDPKTMAMRALWESGAHHPKQTEYYFSHYNQFDPFVIELPTFKKPSRAVQYTDFTDISQAYKTEMADLFQIANYHHTIAVTPFIKGVPAAVVSLRRAPGESDFDNDETEVFEWFANHLALGLERASLMNKLYGAQPMRLFLCLPDGRIAMASDAMTSLLDLLPSDANFRVPHPDHAALTVQIVDHVWRVESHTLDDTSLLSSSGALGLSQTPLLARLTRKLQMPRPLPVVSFLVTVEPITTNDDITRRLIALHLTPKELEVATRLLQGLNLKEIAYRCKIVLATVKDHLRHIYQKSGVTNRSEFAAKMFNPPEPGTKTNSNL